jgi:hypothetical protein
MKITICGSMTFADELQRVGDELMKIGHEVSLPAEIHKHTSKTITVSNRDEKMLLDVFKIYSKEIEESDAILIVNPEKKGISDYIGANSLIEMSFAYVLDKPIYIFYDIPEMDYTDEIVAMKPICLEGNLEKFRSIN